MLQEYNRRTIIIVFAISVLFVLLTLINKWNAYIDNENLGAAPIVFTIFALVGISFLTRIAFKLSDKEMLDELIKQKEKEAKAEILNEIKEQEQKRKEKEEKKDNTLEDAKKLVPKGNFKSIEAFSKKLMVQLADSFNLVQGLAYASDNGTDFKLVATYATTDDDIMPSFKLGENLNGEAAKHNEITVIEEIPQEYIKNVESGLGSAAAGVILFVPIFVDNKTTALLELGAFGKLSAEKLSVIKAVSEFASEKVSQIGKA